MTCLEQNVFPDAFRVFLKKLLFMASEKEEKVKINYTSLETGEKGFIKHAFNE